MSMEDPVFETVIDINTLGGKAVAEPPKVILSADQHAAIMDGPNQMGPGNHKKSDSAAPAFTAPKP